MLLHRLILDPRSREVQRDIADPRQMHRTLLSAFPAQDGRNAAFRAEHGLLHRVEPETAGSRVVVLVQTRIVPDWERFQEAHPHHLCTMPESRSLDAMCAALVEGDRFLFRLRANVTRKLVKRDSVQPHRAEVRIVEKDGHSLTRGVRRGIYSETERLDWLHRKGERHGYALLPVASDAGVFDVRIVPESTVREQKHGGLAFASVLFEGRLRVSDVGKFREALANGIGSAKAFGFGLLSVRRA